MNTLPRLWTPTKQSAVSFSTPRRLMTAAAAGGQSAGSSAASSVCGVAMLQYDAQHQPAFLHANLVKRLVVNELTQHPYFTHMARYANDTLDNTKLTAAVVGLPPVETAEEAARVEKEWLWQGLCVVLDSSTEERVVDEVPDTFVSVERAVRRYDDEMTAQQLIHSRSQHHAAVGG